MKLAGQVAIVTGGGSGQGKATAILFAQEGAKVVVGDINDKGAAETASLINRQEGGQAVAVKVNVTKADEVQGMVDTALSHYGRLDILINNAGTTLFKGIEDTTEEDWDRILNTNLKGVFLGCKSAIPAMRRSGGGSIVNIASVAGLIGMAQHFAYCAAKAGVIHFTKSLALDHGQENIRINCICPGGVLTPMLGGVIDVNNPAQIERIAKQHALGRIADPEEIARVSLFLCSTDASFMTGAAVTVDGGIAAGRMGHMHSR
ncbi:MAG TPA: SDR family oxidoreductase [Candidatus Binatia bacterium]|nr:SDR family oxidoreductase [Candidatus Binatia bacterium]